MAVLCLAVLSVVGASVLQTISHRYDYSQKAVGWSEALNAAEAGTNFGFANCVWSLGNSGTGAWTGWKKFDITASTWMPVTNQADGDNELSLGNRLVYDLPANLRLLSTGGGHNRSLVSCRDRFARVLSHLGQSLVSPPRDRLRRARGNGAFEQR